MTHKRLLSVLLAAAIAVSLLVMPAAAFSDLKGHWAEAYINDVSSKGVFKGYEDGTFRPSNNVTAMEALVLSGRVCGVSTGDKALIAKEWADDLDDILKTSYTWAREELAVCLETGILSLEELRTLNSTGALGKEMAKEDLAMYLVRAMGMEEMAAGLSGYTLDFKDAASVSAERRPYVYILQLYDIVEGDTNNNFSPKLAVNRAVVATMMSRVIDFMDENGVVIELPEYTDYTWQAGTIAGVQAGGRGVTLLSLQNDLSGDKTISLPDTVKVYRYNMLAGTSAIQAGLYARVAFNSAGTPTAVRLFDLPQSVSGTVSSCNQEQLVINAGGTARTLAITRFTEVEAGRKTGGREVIDPEGGYTGATGTVDAAGNLVTLTLTGGSSLEEGILAGVETGKGGVDVLSVTGFDGVTRQFEQSAGATITINSKLGTVSQSHKGDYISLRISNDTGLVLSAAVDTVTRYVQGGVRTIGQNKKPVTIGINNLLTGKTTTYDVATGVDVTYAGEEASIKDVTTSWFATARLNGSDVVEQIIGYPGTSETSGELTDISYGTTVVLTVTAPDGTVSTFDLDVSDLPAIKRGDKSSSLDKLKVGDTVTVSVKFNKVTLIESEGQEANLKGTITRIVQEADGSTIELLLEDGTTASYLVSSGVSITSDGKAIAISALKVGYELSMLVSGDTLVSIEVENVPSVSGEVSGTVLFVNTSEKTILLQTAEDSIVTVSTGSSTKLMTLTGGTFTLRSLSEEAGTAQITAYGEYDGLEFNATLILKK